MAKFIEHHRRTGEFSEDAGSVRSDFGGNGSSRELDEQKFELNGISLAAIPVLIKMMR